METKDVVKKLNELLTQITDLTEEAMSLANEHDVPFTVDVLRTSNAKLNESWDSSSSSCGDEWESSSYDC